MSRQAEEMQSALQYLVTSEMPGEHKRVLIDLVTDRLRSLDSESRQREALERQPLEWLAQDSEAVAASLQGKSASSWQNADELLMGLSTQLKRDPRDVRRKAVELGFGVAVDFGIAKLQKQKKIAEELQRS